MQKEELKKLITDPRLFFRLLKIRSKRGELIPLILNGEQEKMLEAYLSDRDDLLIVKPRQIGSSTFWCAILFWEAWRSRDPKVFFSMSHTMDSAKNFMTMWQTMYENLPKPFQRSLSTLNQSTMQWADSGAKLVVKTAGGKGGVRSFTATMCHLSEFAFYDDPSEVMATVIPALNGGRVIIESTPNFFGDALHERFIQSSEDGSFKTLFFPWWAHKEYSEAGGDFILTPHEEHLQTTLGLTRDQLSWRRRQIKLIGLHKFKRDYPISINEAYSQGAQAYFSEEELSDIVGVQPTGNEILLQPYDPKIKYAIGADTSMGVGRDYSWLWVINAQTREPVYAWWSNRINPKDFADQLAKVGHEWGKALILVESNNTGLVTVQELKNMNYPNLWKLGGSDWLTTSKTKPELFAILREELSLKHIKKIDIYTLAQLRGLKVEKNNVVFPTNEMGHADSVMALALAFRCTNDVSLRIPSQPKNIVPFRKTKTSSYAVR